MERATYTTKSFIIALALVFRSVTPEQAALAASVEVNSQIERWGEVEDSEYGSFGVCLVSKCVVRSYANLFFF
jgi:chaperone required for assembly of F1-ATPase